MSDAPKESVGIFQKIKTILEMIRFSHTIFALPFALLSAVMCWTVPPLESVDLDLPGFRSIHLLSLIHI